MKYTIIIIACFASFIFSSVFAEDDGYPKSRQERKADEMGSMLGGEGIVFRPGKIRNETTKTQGSKVNKFLWQASLEIISDIAPIVVNDSEKGLISTDWYSNKSNPKNSMKTSVAILDNIISPEAIEVTIQQKTFKNGRWLESDLERAMKLDIETKILRRAKELYINNSKK